jgi:Effector Associated Constant Component 1
MKNEKGATTDMAAHPGRVTITPGSETAADELYSLRAWLLEEDELRGRVRVVEHPPAPGKLGTLPEALTIVLGPGGVSTVVAGALIAWMRYRTSDVRLKVTGSDGSTVEVDGRRLRSLSATDVAAQLDHLRRILEEQSGDRCDSPGGASAIQHPIE